MRPAALFLAFLPLLTAAPADTKAGKIERLINGYVQDGKFQGSMLVAERGEVIVKKGFGFANIELQAPNTPDTKFRIGSVTKQFTAMLVMQLVSRGKLRLEGKISDYVPEYPRKSGERITIHQLLSHQSGTPNYTNPEFFEKRSRLHFSPIELARTFWDKPVDFEPGARHSYSIRLPRAWNRDREGDRQAIRAGAEGKPSGTTAGSTVSVLRFRDCRRSGG